MNKTLSSKLMIQEKSYVDEKRLRLDLEKRLSAVLSSQPAAGPGRGASSDGISDQNQVDDLVQMQYSLASVNQRVKQSLQ